MLVDRGNDADGYRSLPGTTSERLCGIYLTRPCPTRPRLFRMVGGCLRAGWPLLLSLLAACGTVPLRGQQGLLDFLTDGSTRREEVITRLG